MFEELEWLYSMAVWDAQGRMYMPILDYDDEIMCYAPAQEAIEVWTTDWS